MLKRKSKCKEGNQIQAAKPNGLIKCRRFGNMKLTKVVNGVNACAVTDCILSPSYKGERK